MGCLALLNLFVLVCLTSIVRTRQTLAAQNLQTCIVQADRLSTTLFFDCTILPQNMTAITIICISLHARSPVPFAMRHVSLKVVLGCMQFTCNNQQCQALEQNYVLKKK